MCQVIQPPKDYMITRRETWLVVTETVYRVPAWSEGEAMAQFQQYEPMVHEHRNIQWIERDWADDTVTVQ